MAKTQTAATQEALGAALKPAVSSNTIGKYLRRGMPTKGPAGYDVRRCQRWVDEYVAPNRRGDRRQQQEAGGGGESKADLECEKLRIDIQRRKLWLAREAGKLVDRSAAEATLRRILTLISNRLDVLPSEAVSGVPPDLRPEIIGSLETSIRMVRREILSELEQLKGQEW